MTLIDLAQNSVYAAIVVAFLWLGKKMADLGTTFNEDVEIEERNNLAVGVHRAGFYLGIVLAMVGSVSGVAYGFYHDVIALLVDGAVALPLMFVAWWITDKILLPAVDDNRAILDGNVAVSIVSAGNSIATGLILNGSFAGPGGGIASALVFFALGQVMLVVGYLVFRWLLKVDLSAEVANSNAAAALASGGFLVSLAYVLKASLTGPFVSWTADITSFGVSAIFGIGLLLVAAWVVDHLFLPTTTLQTEIVRDRNVSALTLTAGTMFALALIVGAVV